MNTKQTTKLVGVGFAGLVVLLFISALNSDSETITVQRIAVGSEVSITRHDNPSNCSEKTLVAVDLPILTKIRQAERLADPAEFYAVTFEMISSGEIMSVDSCTRSEIISAPSGLRGDAAIQVRILEGEFENRTGWIFANYAKNILISE